jgi:hypothetical protein
MNMVQNVSATFTPVYSLTASIVGSGTITSDIAGIACGADCIESYLNGTVVTLTATPEAGFTFTGWGGACSGTGTCVVTMNVAQSVSATFTPTTYSLSVSLMGSGTVTSDVAGIACGADCSESYLSGTTVTLSAAPEAGSTFTGWSGAGCAGTGTCVVTMSTAQNVTATFTTP